MYDMRSPPYASRGHRGSQSQGCLEQLLRDVPEQIIALEHPACSVDLDSGIVAEMKRPPTELIVESAVVVRPALLFLIGFEERPQVAGQCFLLTHESTRAQMAVEGIWIIF